MLTGQQPAPDRQACRDRAYPVDPHPIMAADDLKAFIHTAHRIAWRNKPHECMVPDCPGDTGERPTAGQPAWECWKDGQPPYSQHSTPGHAVDPPRKNHPASGWLNDRHRGSRL
jgi:hypothetical protein